MLCPCDVLQFDDVGRHGTKVIIFNLWRDEDDALELDFDTDPHVLFYSMALFNIRDKCSELSAVGVVCSLVYEVLPTVKSIGLGELKLDIKCARYSCDFCL